MMETNDRINKLLEFYKLNNQDPFIIYALANEYNQLGDIEHALNYYNIVHQNFPDYVATYYHLGKLKQRLGDKEEAINLFETGLKYAKIKNDQHSFAELQTALTNLNLGIDDDE